MIKVYLDASVIIAALLSSSGGSAKLIELGNMGVLVTITSQTVIDEVINNSSKIKKSEKQVLDHIFKNKILVSERVDAQEMEDFSQVVESKDAHVLAGATSTKCTHIATLDKKHLLQPKVKRYMKPIKIKTPGEVLQELVD